MTSDRIPAVGPPGRWISYWGVHRFLKDGQATVQEGVEKYKNAVPFMVKWIVVISDPKLINNVRQARDELTFYKAVDEITYRQSDKSPLIIQRLHDDELLGKDRPDRPVTFIENIIAFADRWSLFQNDSTPCPAPEAEKGIGHSFIEPVLVANFAAPISTPTNTARKSSEYALPLREEVEAIIGEEGWSKAAMGEMLRVDSFVRETVRYQGINAPAMSRIVAKSFGFTFSDGTHPKRNVPIERWVGGAPRGQQLPKSNGLRWLPLLEHAGGG
ncbi:hypothetical protein BDN71DRAFT_1427462 [Pleurotus eryngii]|uniref:Uncharacterized protein n=1 Tax=Pleurotus eryngii TaxID=5323 RepID=A0A9P6A5A0_PLEER|nr:hypothetical protein BDN71DRAFT_1427462 [Pleurotus eryngii]